MTVKKTVEEVTSESRACLYGTDLDFARISPNSMYSINHIECIENVFERSKLPINTLQLSATDLLALASMKNAAKCDK